MVQVYIKHIDNNFYALDLEESESINYKLTVKDLKDITKVFSPFTQSFTIKATDKNKILCGFWGNEKTLKANPTGEFDAMIYVMGFIFQSGKLTFDESAYENLDQKNFKTNFASNLSGIVERLGDFTIQDLFNKDEPLTKTPWNTEVLHNRMGSIKNTKLANGIEFKWGIPFISNERVWNYDAVNLAAVDNIAFRLSRPADSTNFIALNEVRPAVNFMSIMNHLLLKIGQPVICPIFESPEVKDIYAWCTSENLIVENAKLFRLINYALEGYYARYDIKENNGPAPSDPKWLIDSNRATGIFSVQRTYTTVINSWGDGFDITLKFNNMTPAYVGQETKIKVNLIDADTNIVVDSQDISNDTYNYRLIDIVNGYTRLNSSGAFNFRFEILPLTLLNWSNITVKTVQSYWSTRKSVFGAVSETTRVKFSYGRDNNAIANTLGGNSLDLINTLPNIKAIDFLRSFLKMFNISVISTGLQDQSMYWLTPENLKEINKPYSKRVVTYTNGVLTSKKKANQFNQYSFAHKESKYFDSIYGNGRRFGSLLYPEIEPKKPTKFEVKTDFSIMKQSNSFTHPNGIRTSFGFANGNPEILDNGAYRYKPVFGEFTLMYLKSKSISSSALCHENTVLLNRILSNVLEANFVNYTNQKTLAFGAEDVFSNSLYLNYYKSFIERLLNSNSYASEFTLYLPPNEIFLNFANQNANEANIPTGFRPQNEIIIGEQRYELIDSGIDLTTGKAKLTLLNF